MENKFLKNKIIINYCKDYYKIINETFSDKDVVSEKLIQIYQRYVFSIDVKDKNNLKRAVDLNDAVSRYFDDREFKTMLSNHLKALKIPKEGNVILYIVNSIIKIYQKYKEGYTRNLYIPKWI